MIQRIQTLWLSLAAIVSLLTLKFSFYAGNVADTSVPAGKKWMELTGVNNFLILVLTVAITVISLIVIFLYKNRMLQLRLTILTIVISLLNLYLYFNETKKFAEGNILLTSVLSFIIPIFLVLAARGIYRDEKLIKSADRLR
jgi:Domain of unknown function (DUF4293)